MALAVAGCGSGAASEDLPVNPLTENASTAPILPVPSAPATDVPATPTVLDTGPQSSTPATAGAAATAAPPMSNPAPTHFATLPVGATLPTEEYCAAHVRSAREVRPQNDEYNHTTGAAAPPQTGYFARVTGNFTGTTDELIQWAACKWGIDEDLVRAQAAKESWWYQTTTSDFSDDPTHCVPDHPIGVDGKDGQCPESIGLLQLRFPYIPDAFPMATESSAYNLDYALAYRRHCFEGLDPWLNTVERGQDYAAGDLWGCVGAWFAGRWYTDPAKTYIDAVRGYLDQQVWKSSDFIEG
jgi:hypothetical protein